MLLNEDKQVKLIGPCLLPLVHNIKKKKKNRHSLHFVVKFAHNWHRVTHIHPC